MQKILVSQSVPVSINGTVTRIPANRATPVSAEVLTVLDNSNITYELVGAPPVAPAEGEGVVGTPSPSPEDAEGAPAAPAPVDQPVEPEQPTEPEVLTDERRAEVLALLDGSVPSIKAGLAALTDAELAAMIEAEKAGKTRATLVSAIELEQASRT